MSRSGDSWFMDLMLVNVRDRGGQPAIQITLDLEGAEWLSEEMQVRWLQTNDGACKDLQIGILELLERHRAMEASEE